MAESPGTLERQTTPNGETVFVDRGSHEPGGIAAFYPYYADSIGTDRLGFMCGNCGSVDATMDTMGRIECSDCENDRLPTRTDASYL